MRDFLWGGGGECRTLLVRECSRMRIVVGCAPRCRRVVRSKKWRRRGAYQGLVYGTRIGLVSASSAVDMVSRFRAEAQGSPSRRLAGESDEAFLLDLGRIGLSCWRIVERRTLMAMVPD